MPYITVIYSFTLLLLTLSSVEAQQAYVSHPEEGIQLQEQGRSRAALPILQLFLQEHQTGIDKQEGVALNALGSAYQDLEEYDQARRAYEKSILVLARDQSGTPYYAEALDNLGSLELRMGHLDESERLRKRAHMIYARTHDYTGLSRTANNLAVIAFTRGKLHEADLYLDEAFREAASTASVPSDDLASMYNLRGRLAEGRKDFQLAISAQREALRLWQLIYSPSSYKIAIGYTALGSAEAGSGDLTQALVDLRQAMSLEKTTSINTRSRASLETELVYARVLKLSGDERQAALIETEARAKLVQTGRPAGTVSAISLQAH